MFISVALCTYNGDQFLKAQIDSILSQSLLPDEIVVCDDKSTDTTLSILENYEQNVQKPIFKIATNETTLRVTKNFEKAISLCTGDYIFLCDQDDIWNPEKVQKTVSFFEAHPNVDVVFTNGNLIGLQNGTLWNRAKFDAIQQKAWKTYGPLYTIFRYKSMCTGASMAVKKQAREYLLPIPKNPFHIHDGWIGLKAASLNKLAYINECLFDYRIHAEQWSMLQSKVHNNSVKANMLYRYEHMKYFINYFGINNRIILQLYDHFHMRLNLNKNIFKRCMQIAKELFNGNYFKHSHGLSSAIRDVILP